MSLSLFRKLAVAMVVSFLGSGLLGLGFLGWGAQAQTSPHSVHAALGFTEGGFALGADYENSMFEEFGLGGYGRIYKKDDDKSVPAYMAFGVFIRPHFYKKNWDLYVSPGFGFLSVDAKKEDESTFGPSLALGLLYKIHDQISVGVENMKHYAWFSDDYRGLVVNDFMIKAQIQF